MELGALYATKRVAEYANQSLLFRVELSIILSRYCSGDWGELCKKLHVAAPSFVIPQKHYEATVIVDAKAGKAEFCPADNSTIRRWRR